MRLGFNLSFLTPIDIHKLPKSTLIHLYLGTFLNSVPPENHTPLKNYERRHHLLYIFHGGRPGGRPPWKMYRRWLFPYKFCVGYSVATKLMRVRSFDEFWRSSWKLMRVIRRTILLYINIEKVSNCFVIIETKLNTVMIMIDSTYWKIETQ